MDPLNIIKEAIGYKYQIQSVIGKGGMATVYKAIHKSLNRPVALKVIHQNLVHDDEFIKRFLREAQTCASLNHQNIVTVYDVDSVGTVHYMSMEYLEGKTIRELILENDSLSHEETVRYLTPIAEALSYMHGRKVFHRDIKSSNIIITNSGRPVLMDFGIVFSEGNDPLSHDGAILGTPEYMSPEQAMGENKIDGRSDIYSLGMIMYECLTGRLPFQTENYFATLNKVVNDILPTVTSINPKVPKWLSGIVSGCLIKDRDKRIQNGRILLEALRNREKPELPVPKTKKDQETKIFKSEEVNEFKPHKEEEHTRFKPKDRKFLLAAMTVLLGVIIIIMGWLFFRPPAAPLTSKNNRNGPESKSLNGKADTGLISNTTTGNQKDTNTLTKLITDTSFNQTAETKSRIETLMSTGNQFFNNGNYQAAIERYNQILALDPSNTTVHQMINDASARWIQSLINSARTNMDNGNFTRAANILDQALNLEPENFELRQLSNRARSGQHIKEGKNYLENRNFDEAINSFVEAQYLDPSNQEIDGLIEYSKEIRIKYNFFRSLNINEVRITGTNVRPYWIGTTEVTQQLWYRVMNSNPSSFKNSDLLPVESVGYIDIMEFIDELNERTGMNFRLPTESEWIYAAKGGSQSRNYTFSGSNDLSNVAWYDTSSTHEVGTKQSNEVGIYDMSGNVWEWTSTRQGDAYVTKGGGWFSTSEYCQTNNHQLMRPERKDRYTGFRLCRDI